MIRKFLYAILAGIAISMGSIVYLLTTNKIVGSLLFAVGILMVIEFKFNLVTGFIPTRRDKMKFSDYIVDVLFIFTGNIVGAILVALLMRLTRQSGALVEASLAVSNTKINDNFLSLFILAIFCGFIIAMIVKADNYKQRVLYVAMMISVFILAGFEHCVADAFYFAMSLKLFTWRGLLVLLIVFLGNFVGGFLSSFIKEKIENKKEENKENDLVS